MLYSLPVRVADCNSISIPTNVLATRFDSTADYPCRVVFETAIIGHDYPVRVAGYLGYRRAA